MADARFTWADRRQELIHRRLSGISAGLATFFRDAAKLMAGGTGLEAAPHFVAHACREIESGLRDVLRGVAGLEKPSGEAGHRADIEAILSSLGVGSDDPIAVLWLEMPASESALHAMAHRRGLSARTEIGQLSAPWDRFQAVLALVLDRLEATSLRAFGVIDSIVNHPTSSNLSRLRGSIPQNQVTLSYFFEKAGPDWIAVLDDSDLLSPDDVPDDVGRFAGWPAARWIPRAAAADAGFAEAQAKRMTNTQNPVAGIAGIEMLMAIPVETAASLIAEAVAWISVGGGTARDRAVDLAVRFQSAGRPDEALEITRAVLEMRPTDG